VIAKKLELRIYNCSNMTAPSVKQQACSPTVTMWNQKKNKIQ